MNAAETFGRHLAAQLEKVQGPTVLMGDVHGVGEEPIACPNCGTRDVDVDECVMAGDVWTASCVCNQCGHAWRAEEADPQCGECREFLPDGAEDDSLCDTCKETTHG